MKCSLCGSNLNSGDKYCTHCGNKLKKSRWHIWIIISVIIISLISLIIYTVFKNNNDVEEAVVVPEKSSTKFGNIKVDIPNGIGYSVENEVLTLTAPNGSWFAKIGVIDGSYETLKKNKAMLKESILASSDSAKDAEVKEIGNVEYVTIEFGSSGTNYLGAYSKIDSNKIMTMTFVVVSGDIDDKLLEKVAPIVSSAKVDE